MKAELRVPFDNEAKSAVIKDAYCTLADIIADVPHVKSLDMVSNQIVLTFDQHDRAINGFQVMNRKGYKVILKLES